MLAGMRAALVVVIAVLGCSSPAPPPPAKGPSEAPRAAPAGPRVDPMAMGGFPVPPRQGQPARVGAGTLPAPLVSAIGALFRHGLADPRGCAYREIEVMTGSVWGGQGTSVKTHGWVLPPQRGGKAWAIAWNGLVYPAASVGAAADLRADVSAIVAAQLAARADPKQAGAGARPRSSPEEYGVSHETPDPVKVALVHRLGEPLLASQLWSAIESPEDLARGGDPYLRLAVEWAWELFERAVTAHMRGDTPVALASARLLAAAAPQIEAEADRRKLPRDRADRHVGFIEQLPLLVADEERRARRGPREKLEPRALAALDPPARARLLIEHLDEVAARQWGQPGGVNLADDPIVDALIELGAPAVELLIEVLEADTRLTRSVHFWRDFARHRSLLGVHEAAYVALAGILEQSFFDPASTGDNLSARGAEGRRQVADRVRAYWDTWKKVPLEERWLQVLADDRATPEQWLDAADKITRPRNVRVRPSSTVFTTTVTSPGAQGGLRGDPLRSHRNPTVTEAIERRWRDPRIDVRGACALADMLARWDPAAGKPVMAKQLDRAIRAGGGHEHARCIAVLAGRLGSAGDLAAIDRYAGWIAGMAPPEYLDTGVFEPMWQHARRPAVARAAEALFRDGSAWVPLIAVAPGSHRDRDDLLHTQLLGVAAFNRHVLAGLSDARRAGTLTMGDDRGYSIALASGGSLSTSAQDDAAPPPPPEGTTHDVRVADWYAWKLAGAHAQAPRFQPYWPRADRDDALERMRAWVRAQLPAR